MKKLKELQTLSTGHFGVILFSFIFIALILGYAIGYMAGVSYALNWGVGVAYDMFETQGIKVEFNPKMVAAAMYQFKNNIGGSINCGYAPLHNNTGN